MTLSTSEKIPNIKVAKNAQKKIRIKQRALARCKPGKKRRIKIKRELARAHRKIKNTRKTYLHQVSAKLTQEFSLIAVEKLQITNMMQNHKLAGAIHDASWGELKHMLIYKAEKAGGKVIEVDAKYTSQDCSCCGQRKKMPLEEREYKCDDTNCELHINPKDRDVNAAINILHKAIVGLELPKVVRIDDKLATRNIALNNMSYST